MLTKKQPAKKSEQPMPKKSAIMIQGIMRESFFDSLKKKNVKEVVVLEGRPGLDALHHSCKQLIKRKITPTVIADNMAGFLFYRDLVKEVWLSYQVGDADGALCDIGALILGVLGKRHGVPVMCYPAAKKTAFIGKPKRIFNFNDTRVAPKGIDGYVPLMEWVPGIYIEKIYE